MEKQEKKDRVLIYPPEMFERIHQRTGMPVSMTSSAYEAILEEIIEVLSEGKDLVFRGFGTFSVKKSTKLYNVSEHAPNKKNKDHKAEPLTPRYRVKFSASRIGSQRFRELLEKRGYEDLAPSEDKS